MWQVFFIARLCWVHLKPDIDNMRNQGGGNVRSPPAGPNSDLEILVTFLIIGLERSDFMRILDLKFLKFGLNFEMLTWTFPKSQNLFPKFGKIHVAFQNLTQISEISNPKFSQNLSAQLQLLRKELHPVACCVCRALSTGK